MDNTEVKTFLKSWVNSAHSPKFAVMIEGEWGSGKTHFVRSLLNDASFSDKETIYVSLFGKTSAHEFERELFFASVSKTTKYIHKGLGLASSVFSSGVSLGTGGILSGTANLEGMMSAALKQAQKSNEKLNKSLIVIDDVERCAFDASELLGILNGFIEHGDARVILVANSEKISDPKFSAFREKVVGHSFQLPQDVDGVLHVFIEDSKEPSVVSTLTKHKAEIARLYRLSNYKNLRALRQYIWTASDIIRKMDAHHLENDALLLDILFESFIFLMEFKLDIGGLSSLLSVDDICDSNFLDANGRSFHDWELNKDEPETNRRLVMNKYELGHGITTVLSLEHWVSILKSGVIESERLNRELAESLRFNDPKDWPSWKRLWHFWDFDYGDSVEQFETDVADLLKAFDERRYKNPKEFLQAASIAIMLADSGLISGSVAVWTRKLKKYASDVVFGDFTYDYHRLLDRYSDSGYDGLGYVGEGEKPFEELRKHVATENANWIKAWKKSQAPKVLLDLMRTDPDQMLGDVTVINGKGMQRFLDEAILNTFDVDQFVDILLHRGAKFARRFLYDIFQRYPSRPHLLTAEATWWKVVATRLEAIGRADTVKPRSVQVQWLASYIRRSLPKP